MNWEKVRLSNIASMRTGKLDSNAAVENGDYPFFTCSQQTFRINEPAFDTKAVLLGGNNAAGIFPLKYYEGQFNAYQRTYVIESLDSEVLNIRFLFYSLKPALSHFKSVSIGAATQYLTKGILDNFQIALPFISEQGRIASTLSAYDDLMENNRRRIQLLEQAARLLYKEWFVHLRFPGHEHAKIIDGVPEGWSEGIVSDFYNTSSGGTPSRKVKDYYTGKIPWVKTQELTGNFVLTTKEMITDEAVKHSSAKLFPMHTVLIAMYGATIGQTGILSIPSATNQACCAVMPKISGTSFVHAYLFFSHHKADLVSLGQGAAQNNISQQVIKSFKMVLPPKKMLELFLDSVLPLFYQIETLQKLNIDLDKARDLLLPRLMNGEVAV
jgi:type I restriction enzyme, S subunit